MSALALSERVRHVVVLMLENRSFDHMLGSTVPQEGVTLDFTATPYANVGPDHSHLGVMWQLTGKQASAYPEPYTITMNGFVDSYEDDSRQKNPPFPGNGPTILKCQPRENVPVLSALARAFAVCTNWHCSVPGETWPNRNYAHAGTSDGEADIKKRAFTNDTIYERLEEANQTWRVYHDGIPQVWVFTDLWVDIPRRANFRDIDDLEDDVKNNDLPAYTFIEPRHFGKSADSQHPDNPANERSFHAGEALIKRVYDAITSNPEVWKSTLLVITYDEHGGYYDHVVPPAAPRPDKKASVDGFLFDLYGVRVPAVLVSPWIAAGTVDATLYDHTTIPHSVRSLFATGVKPLSDREAESETFWHNISETMREDIPAVDISAAAKEKLAVIAPIAAAAAGLPQQTALPDHEEPYAWLAYNVARSIQTGSPAMHFWEDVSSKLKTSIAAAAAADPATTPVVITNSDDLSAFGQHVAQMLRDSVTSKTP